MRNISLHCLAGPLKGQVFRLTGGPVFIFGRYAKSTFSLAADPAASHLHFLVDISEDRVRIVDLGSTNGLVINDRHVSGKQGPPTREFVTLTASINDMLERLQKLLPDNEDLQNMIDDIKKDLES